MTDKEIQAAKQARRDYHRKWTERNRESVNEYHRKWTKDNPDKVKASQLKYWGKKAAEL